VLEHLVRELLGERGVHFGLVLREFGDEGELLGLLALRDGEQRLAHVDELQVGGERVGEGLRDQEEDLQALGGDLHAEAVELLVEFAHDEVGALHDGPYLVVRQPAELLRDLVLRFRRALLQSLHVLLDAHLLEGDVLPVVLDDLALDVAAELVNVDEVEQLYFGLFYAVVLHLVS